MSTRDQIAAEIAARYTLPSTNLQENIRFFQSQGVPMSSIMQHPAYREMSALDQGGGGGGGGGAFGGGGGGGYDPYQYPTEGSDPDAQAPDAGNVHATATNPSPSVGLFNVGDLNNTGNIAPAFNAFEGAPITTDTFAGRFGDPVSAPPPGWTHEGPTPSPTPSPTPDAPSPAPAPSNAPGYGVIGPGYSSDSVGMGYGGATGDGTSGGFGADVGGPGIGGSSTGISGGPGGTGEGGANTGEGGTGVSGGYGGGGEGGGGGGGGGGGK